MKKKLEWVFCYWDEPQHIVKPNKEKNENKNYSRRKKGSNKA